MSRFREWKGMLFINTQDDRQKPGSLPVQAMGHPGVMGGLGWEGDVGER